MALLKSLLVPGGLFVQWDWRAPDDSEPGLTNETISAAFASVGLEIVSLSAPFSLEIEEGTMEVLMAVGRNAIKRLERISR